MTEKVIVTYRVSGTCKELCQNTSPHTIYPSTEIDRQIERDRERKKVDIDIIDRERYKERERKIDR